jgi:hypothetical protein
MSYGFMWIHDVATCQGLAGRLSTSLMSYGFMWIHDVATWQGLAGRLSTSLSTCSPAHQLPPAL